MIEYDVIAIDLEEEKLRESYLLPDVKGRNATNISRGPQLSNCVTTQTGVNNSPTLIKRRVRTSRSVADGDIVIIGSLEENRESSGCVGFSSSGFFNDAICSSYRSDRGS
ncbi:hypothetical protein ACIPEN_02670 [Herbaspirillum chlorophenolicum]|uniref:Uncharacterized protein n=1 Tax=Herbaspirillum chlorophenolicum TaxID=211589 RepID=A0ABW8ETD3_9BURK